MKNLMNIQLFSILFFTTINNASATQNCSNMPPKCLDAQNRAVQLVNSFPSTTGITDSASQGYCGLLVGIEVNSFCADQFRAEGNSDCADLADQQVAEYERVLPQYEAAAQATSSTQIRQACSWKSNR
jgi:hypothetical protein